MGNLLCPRQAIPRPRARPSLSPPPRQYDLAIVAHGARTTRRRPFASKRLGHGLTVGLGLYQQNILYFKRGTIAPSSTVSKPRVTSPLSPGSGPTLRYRRRAIQKSMASTCTVRERRATW